MIAFRKDAAKARELAATARRTGADENANWPLVVVLARAEQEAHQFSPGSTKKTDGAARMASREVFDKFLDT
jgi:hypothetical protein